MHVLVSLAALWFVVAGAFTFSLVQAASWADPDKHDLAQPDDRGKR